MFGRPSQAGPGASVSLKNGSATLLGATFSSHVCEHHCQPATTYGHRHTVNSKAYTLEIRFLICFLKCCVGIVSAPYRRYSRKKSIF